MASAARADRIPQPLPRRLLADLATRRKLLLLLDYDGTISPIVSAPAAARPHRAAPRLIARLAARPDRLRVAIVSGRRIAQLRKFLGLGDGLLMAGVHGLELTDRRGRVFFAPGAGHCLAELEKVRRWIAANVPDSAGFVIEDKQVSIALHYRNAGRAAAAAIRRRLRRYLSSQASGLKIGRGKMLVEVMPAVANKGAVVTALARGVGRSFLPVYFGDDATDEDAFAALRNCGITVLVGGRRRSLARYRIGGPAQVVAVLAGLAAAIGAERARPAVR